MSTVEPPTTIARLKESVRHMKTGGVMNTVEIDELLFVLNEVEPDPAAAPPAVMTVGGAGPKGELRAYGWNAVSGRYDIDQGPATVTPVTPPVVPLSTRRK